MRFNPNCCRNSLYQIHIAVNLDHRWLNRMWFSICLQLLRFGPGQHLLPQLRDVSGALAVALAAQVLILLGIEYKSLPSIHLQGQSHMDLMGVNRSTEKELATWPSLKAQLYFFQKTSAKSFGAKILYNFRPQKAIEKTHRWGSGPIGSRSTWVVPKSSAARSARRDLGRPSPWPSSAWPGSWRQGD